MRVASIHYVDGKNAGDTASGPYLYFEIPGDVQDIRRFVPVDAAIFGGGAIGSMIPHMAARCKVSIAWGVGKTIPGMTETEHDTRNFALYGCREYGSYKTVYVPCASCMSYIFDECPQPKRDVVAFLDVKRRNVRAPGVPTEYTHISSFGEALRFIASGETVVANSYHGVYWATLLGRKVICVPYSSKFYGYKFPPTYAVDGDWKSVMAQAQSYPDALEDARADNRAFYDRVLEVLDNANRKESA